MVRASEGERDARRRLAQLALGVLDEVVVAQIDALQGCVDLEHLTQGIQALHVPIRADAIARKIE